jgi:hypothetical protein
VNNIRVRVTSLIYFMLVCSLISSALSLAQEKEQGKPDLPWMIDRPEIQDDEYIPVLRERQHTTPAYRYSTAEFFMVQVNVDQFGQNISGDAANEPSIAIDPTDPNRMAIGWRQFDTIGSSFRQAGYAYSTNGGQTWTFPGVIEPGIFRSDPVLDADNNGTLFYYSLSTSSGYTCEVFKSTDGGATWSSPVPAYGGDKGWMIVDRTGGLGEGNIYCFSRNDVSTTIVMTRSTDGGQFFEPLVTVPQNPGRGTLAVGIDGELYATGLSWNNGQFALARSTNAPDSQAVPVFEFSTQLNLGGQFSAYTGPNPGGLLGQTIVACDNLTVSGSGNVYVLSSVDPPGGDPLDVYFIRSTDRGVTWSSPVRVNDDPGIAAWQWFGTMSMAPNGRIDVVWLDTRDDPGTYLSSLYYSYSVDSGQTWSPNERLSDAFDPYLGWPQQNKMGDYFDMISDDDGASLAWAGTFNGEEDVYYGRISQPTLAIHEDRSGMPGAFSLSQNYPNPFNPSTTIRYRLAKDSQVSLKIYNALGQEVRALVEERQAAGEKTVLWDGQDAFAQEVGSGVYIYRIQVDGFVQSRKMLLLR